VLYFEDFLIWPLIDDNCELDGKHVAFGKVDILKKINGIPKGTEVAAGGCGLRLTICLY
jgi:hypothetical protein